MLSEVTDKETDQVFETPIVQQTSYWSEVKKRMGVNTFAFNFTVRHSDISCKSGSGRRILSDLLVVIEPIDRYYSCAYVPYGPELEPDEEQQGAFLEELSESIRPFLPKGCIMIRYDLFWESPWAHDNAAFDQEGNWMGPPEGRVQEMRLNFSTINCNFRKPFSNILPTNTVFINLSKTEDELLQAMKPKTRYNIGLSERKGVEVKIMDLDNIDIWYKLYADTAARNGINLNDPEYFKAVLSARANCTQSPAEVFMLVAQACTQPLAAMFLVISQKRALYLYGASSSKHRNLMAPYALQWEAIRIARQYNCTEYDMFGVAPNPNPQHPMHGLYRFKTGFGGEIFHSMGCWDYPLMQEEYTYLRSKEIRRQGYHSQN